MIGMKIALTGLIVMTCSLAAIKAIGKFPGGLSALALVTLFFGGAVSAVAGLLWSIWE